MSEIAEPVPSRGRLLDIRQTAGYLGTTERNMRDITRSGELPIVRIGRRVMFHQADLEAYIERHTTPGQMTP